MTSTLIRSLSALALAAGLTACATHVPGSDEHPRLPTERFAPDVSSAPEELALALHAQGLSEKQAEALAAFVEDWRASEGGLIGIQAPRAGAVDAAAAFRMSEGVRSFLIGRGVPADQIELTGYAPGADETAPPLKVGYLRYQAHPLPCGQAWTSITASFRNATQPNFGCAVTSNMSVQVANPADLLGPRTMDPSDAARRDVVIDKYRKGQVTSAERDQQSSGAVSNAVK